jgi:hypothetical protein
LVDVAKTVRCCSAIAQAAVTVAVRASGFCLRQSFAINIGVGHFFGELMTSQKHGPPLTYAYLGFTYRLKLEH